MHKNTSPPETTPGNSRNCAEDFITTSISTLLGKDNLCWGKTINTTSAGKTASDLENNHNSAGDTVTFRLAEEARSRIC
jgi:hypothetical protein